MLHFHFMVPKSTILQINELGCFSIADNAMFQFTIFTIYHIFMVTFFPQKALPNWLEVIEKLREWLKELNPTFLVLVPL